jgi:hypothetical protein
MSSGQLGLGSEMGRSACAKWKKLFPRETVAVRLPVPVTPARFFRMGMAHRWEVDSVAEQCAEEQFAGQPPARLHGGRNELNAERALRVRRPEGGRCCVLPMTFTSKSRCHRLMLADPPFNWSKATYPCE